MDRMMYTRAVVRTRIFEKRLLPRIKMDRLVEAKDIVEVLRQLNDTDYAETLTEIKGPDEYEKFLSRELGRVYREMREISPDGTVCDLLALKYDYHNLKVLVKEKWLEKDLSHLFIPIGTADLSALRSTYREGALGRMEGPFAEALKLADQVFASTRDPQQIDISLDRSFISHLLKLSRQMGVPLFEKYSRTMIDFINCRTAARLKRQGKDLSFLREALLAGGFIDPDRIESAYHEDISRLGSRLKNEDIGPTLIEGLKEGHLAELEKEMDDYLMVLVREAKMVHFGPEPLFAYILAKETEIKNLRIIMVSKINRIPPESIRERMRELYA
jgi:ATP synthase (C/AC39) subunit.